MVIAQAPTLPTDRNGQVVSLEPSRRCLVGLSPLEQLAWALDMFGDGFAITTSFGIQSAVLLAHGECPGAAAPCAGARDLG